jgi:multiple sugar transport system permease protein
MTAAATPAARVPQWSAQSRSAPSTFDKALALPWTNVGMIVLVGYCLLPFLWLMRLSIDPSPTGSVMPSTFTLSNYTAVFDNAEFRIAFMNSIIVSGAATLMAMLVGGFAGYALARLPVPGRSMILFFALAVSMFPTISIVGPLFDMWRSVGLFDTKLGLVLPNVTLALPMSIWIMTSFFRELPSDLEQAAYVDGATPFQAFRKVMLPLAAPGTFTAAILVFISTWNEFLFAISFSATDASRTVPVAIAFFQGKDAFEIPVGSIAAASIVVMVPLIVLVLVFQRRIVAGLTAGGVKG